MPGKGTPRHAIRIDDALWAEFQAATHEAGTNPSETIRQLIRDWVDKNKGGEDMSNERDELARELFIGDNHNQPRESSIQDWRWFEVTGRNQGMVEHYKTMASHIITVGYRRQVDK